MRGDLDLSHVHVVPEVDRPESAARGPQVAVVEGSVEAFRVRDLERILEQQVGHVRGRRRQDDVDVLPTGDPGDHPRVVQVGMADEHAIDRRSGNRILRRIAGQEAVVEEEGRRPLLEDHPEAADLRRAAEKLEIHPGRASMPPASIRPSHRKGGSAVGSESPAPCAAVRSGPSRPRGADRSRRTGPRGA